MADLLRDAIEKCKAYVQPRLVYTGRTANATKLAKPFPLFQGFVETHKEWWETEFNYKHIGNSAGTLAPTYPFFRDSILLSALKELNSKKVEEDRTGYMYRHTPRKGGEVPPRAIFGWETRKA